MVRVGAEEMTTEMVQCKNGFCLWAVEKIMTISVEENQIVPDVFVYLVNNSHEKICFARFNAA